jgi:hypothetical protein
MRHSRAVAETAAWLALRAASRGRSLDRRLVEAAALLHDVDKLPRVMPLVVGLPHGQGAAEWLARQGYSELGPAIIGHPVTRLADSAWFESWMAAASPEALIVAYADKRAGQRLESMADRFASWERRYPPAERAVRARGSWDRETVEEVRQRAQEIERRACDLAGVAPGDVRRLAWTSRVMAAARTGARSAGSGSGPAAGTVVASAVASPRPG